MAIAVGQFTITDYNDIITASVAPTSPTTDMLWVDTSVSPNVLKKYNGTTWDIVNDYSEDIATAQSTADDALAQTEYSLPVFTQSATAVTFTDTVGGTFSGTTFTKTLATGTWNAGFRSVDTFTEGEYFEFTFSTTNQVTMIGFNNGTNDANYTSIDYAFYINSNTFSVYRNGASLGAVVGMTGINYTAADKIRIAVLNNQVVVFKNNILVYVFIDPPTLPLYIDASLYTINTAVQNIVRGTVSASAKYLAQMANQLSCTVGINAYNQAASAVAGLNVGAINFVRNSGHYKDTNYWINVDATQWALAVVSGYMKATRLVAGTPSGKHIKISLTAALPSGAPHTITVRIRTSIARTFSIYFMQSNNTTVQTIGSVTTAANTWKEVSLSVTTNAAVYDQITISAYDFPTLNETIEFEWVMCQRGSKFTGWTLAPEDMPGYVVDNINDGTYIIKSSKIYFSEAEQTLDVKLAAMTTDIGTINTNLITSITDVQVAQGKLSTDIGTVVINHNDLSDTVSSLSTQVTQTTDSFTVRVNAVEAVTSSLDDRVASVEAKTMAMTMTAEGLVISQDASQFSSLFSNTALEFRDGATTVSYINNKSMKITDAVILHSLTLAQWDGVGYFMWEKTTNHLNLKWGA